MNWDEQHVKALLRLPRYPKTLLENKPWSGWLAERHGANAVREGLRGAPLKPAQAELLQLILDSPAMPPLRRAAALHVSQSTYFRYLDVLVRALVDHLNAATPGDIGTKRPAPNLPVPLTPLIGADATLKRITELLADPQMRLLTLTGTGGIGKTRLAIQAARQLLREAPDGGSFDDGIYWVDLAPLRSPELVLVEIARVLNLTERSGYPTLEFLQRELCERRLLLLLDNFEHLQAAAPLVAALLQATTHLKVLVTSRAALNITGEQRLTIPPLALPDLSERPNLERLGQYSTIQFFIQRARAIDDSFALTAENAAPVAQLCVAFDGLPLALEMVARRTNHLSPQKMLGMLSQRFELLAGNAQDLDPRHQSLRNVIDWSYQLLDTSQQAAFQQLAVFADGWTLEAMQAVCAAPTNQSQPPVFDMLAALINHSIVFRQPAGATPRFGMLETIREYAQEKLAAANAEAQTRQRHAAYYLSLSRSWAELGESQEASIAHLESEYHNLRVALQWAVEQDQSALAQDFAMVLWHYWSTTGSPNEGQYWLERVLSIEPPARETKRMHLLWALGEILLYQNDFQRARRYYDELAALAQTLGSRADLGAALQGLGDIAHFTGDYAQATQLYAESLALFRELQNMYGVGWTLDRLGNVAFDQGQVQTALTHYRESLAVFQTLSFPAGIAHAQAKLGLIAYDHGHFAEAIHLFEDSLARLRPQNPDWYYAWLLEYLGQAVLGLGDLPRAAGFFRQSLQIHFDDKAYPGVAHSLQGLANVALAEGQAARAARRLATVQRIYEQYAPVPLRRRQFEASQTRSRAGLDPATFQAAWQSGRALSLEQAVAEGLKPPC